jgi:hypothetical protein
MNNNQNEHIVVVLGMHRSGTSTIARGLKAIKIELGDELMEGTSGNNEKGFFEDMDVFRLNNELLQEIGHDWHMLTPILPEELLLPLSGGLKLRAVEVLRKKLNKTRLFGLKAPQMARLLPFWQAVFTHLNVHVSYIIACRNPMSVARSLSKRDGFNLEKGYYLWLEHMFSILKNTDGQPRIVVDYDLLMDDPIRELQRMAKILAIPFNPDDPDVAEYRTNFLEESLRHSRYYLKDLKLDKSVPDCVLALHKLLLNLAKEIIHFNHHDAVSLLNRIDLQLRENYPALHYMQVCDQQLIDLKKSINEYNKQIMILSQSASEYSENNNKLNHLLSERDKEIDSLNKMLSKRDEKIKYLIQEIKTMKCELDTIYNSKSWLLTKPLRSFKQSLFRLFFRSIIV